MSTLRTIRAINAVTCLALVARPLQADHIRQLDDPGATRTIPDIANGGTVTLDDSQIIDVVMLGDGYLDGEIETFFADAQAWYDGMLDPTTGIRPYTLLSEAFRVRGVFKVSAARATSLRDSYYAIPISCDSSVPPACSISSADFSGGGDNATLRTNLFDAIDELVPAVNSAQYPDGLDVAVTGGNIITSLENMYRNLVVVMLVRTADNDGEGQPDNVSGLTTTITHDDAGVTRIVRVGFGANEKHEFGHAFAYLKDEYIDNRGASDDLSNPAAADRSVFKLSNLSYSNDRCDLIWPHLAPGGQYNPNLFSPIGNLFKGGVNENSVWHSEYQCLMNGTHDNYQCSTDEPLPGVSLRDGSNLCFWCEEIVVVRILEKTGQLDRPTDPADINDRGATWFTLWDDTLRDLYYDRYDLATRIAAKNACYGFGVCPPLYSCAGNCDTTGQPACLFECDIRELGNAIYVDSVGGAAGNPGTLAEPLDTVLDGVAEANAVCGSPRLVAIKSISNPGAMTITDAATLIPAGCDAVLIGN